MMGFAASVFAAAPGDDGDPVVAVATWNPEKSKARRSRGRRGDGSTSRLRMHLPHVPVGDGQ
jgi:hypothetical protein